MAALQQGIQQLLTARAEFILRYSRILRQNTSYYSKSKLPQQHIHAPPQHQTRTFRTSSRRSINQHQHQHQQPPSKSPATSTTSASASTEATEASSSRLRADRVLDRLPRPLRGYTSRLRSAPLSHVVAFLILHELTAIIPLLGLFGLFHYYSTPSSSTSGWVDYILANYGTYVQDGVVKFERYFTRKGWFGFGSGSEGDGQQEHIEGRTEEEGGGGGGGGERQAQELGGGAQAHGGQEEVIRKWSTTDGKYRILVEIALAYALTKALLPIRIVASVSATPWFAGVLARGRKIMSTLGRRKP